MALGPFSFPSTAFSQTRFIRDVSRFTLDNGLVVLIQPSHKAGTASMYLAVKTGSADETEVMGSGLSHYLEHMLFKGTARRKAGQIEDEVRQMGGSTNAYTSYDLTVYYVDFLSSHFTAACDLMSDVIFHSELPQEEMERERQVILGEFRMNEDRLSRKADVELWRLAFQTHPYGHPVIGYDDLFRKVARDDLMAYYRRNYIPNNMVLSVVGDVDPKKAEEAIRKFFGPEARGLIKTSPRPAEPNQMAPRRHVITKEAQHARLSMGWRGVSVSHPDAVALDVLSVVLGEGTSSRLNQRLKEEAKIVLDVSSSNSTLKDSGLFGIRTVALAEQMDEARRLILEEIEELKAAPVAAEDLERVKNQVLARFYKGIETHSSAAHDLLTSEVYTGDYRFSEVYTELVTQVTPVILQTAAKKYLQNETLSEVLLLPAAAKRDAAHAEPGKRSARIHPFTLSNGMRLLVMDDPALPDVNVHFGTLGGTRFETEATNGVSTLTAKLLTKGTSRMSQFEISNAVESWGGALDPFSGQNSYGFTMTILASYLPEALPLAAELITDPVFSEEEIQKAKQIQKEALFAKAEDIFAVAVDQVRKAVWRRHPYRMDPLGTERSIAAITRRDILDFYAKTLRADRAVLAVFGDVDPEGVRKLAEAHFGKAAKGSGKAPEPPREALEKAAYVSKKVPREQAVSLLAFNAVAFNDERRYPYEVLNAVMSGSSGRLYKLIRGEEGLSYVVTSNLSTGLDPGSFFIAASVEPKKAAKVLSLLEAEARRLRQKGITDAELEDAKTQLIGDHEHAMESKSSSIIGTSFSELYGAGYEEFLDYADKVRAVSRQDVERVIKEFIDLEHAVRIIVSPEPPAQEPWVVG